MKLKETGWMIAMKGPWNGGVETFSKVCRETRKEAREVMDQMAEEKPHIKFRVVKVEVREL